jgi:beta-phosphoglucomutase-like phosphatase (HAD superfamily)
VAAVLCDVDGTLVDTTYLHTVCWWQAFVEAGYRLPGSRIRGAIGMAADQLLPYLLGRDPDPDGARALSARHDALFRPYWNRLQPTQGAAGLLRACAGQGLSVVLASSVAIHSIMDSRRPGLGVRPNRYHVPAAVRRVGEARPSSVGPLAPLLVRRRRSRSAHY